MYIKTGYYQPLSNAFAGHELTPKRPRKSADTIKLTE
jgi:hypothetical protein